MARAVGCGPTYECSIHSGHPNAPLAQMARAPVLYSGGRPFEAWQGAPTQSGQHQRARDPLKIDGEEAASSVGANVAGVSETGLPLKQAACGSTPQPAANYQEALLSRALRRYQAITHMMRRLKEDRNQHYNDLTCDCYQPGRGMARFKEQPQGCSDRCCGNPRTWEKGAAKLTRQELRASFV